MSKVHVREERNFLKIAIYPLPLNEETVKDLVRQISKGKGQLLNNVTMLWHADGNHALELIFERLTQPLTPAKPTVKTPEEKPVIPPEEAETVTLKPAKKKKKK